MKRTISLLSALAFVLAFSGSAFAQNTIEASAEVVTDVSYDQSQDVNFGIIDQDITANQPTLSPEAGGSNSNVTGGNQQLGFLVFSGSENAAFQITNSEVTLTETNSSSTVTFTPNFCFDNSDTSGDNGCQDTAEGAGNDVTVTAGSFSGTGTLWIGGNLNTPEDGTGQSTNSLAAGSYSNTFDVTVDYTF